MMKKGRPVGLEGRNYLVGILFGLGGAIGQVANLVTAKYALISGYSALSATWIRTFVAVVIMWGIAIAMGVLGARLWRAAHLMSGGGCSWGFYRPGAWRVAFDGGGSECQCRYRINADGVATGFADCL